MATEIQARVIAAANAIHYDWFNNGFSNFFESTAYAKDLRTLQAFADEFGIEREVKFIAGIYNEAREGLESDRRDYTYYFSSELYSGDWIDENFGEEELGQSLDSIVTKIANAV